QESSCGATIGQPNANQCHDAKAETDNEGDNVCCEVPDAAEAFVPWECGHAPAEDLVHLWHCDAKLSNVVFLDNVHGNKAVAIGTSQPDEADKERDSKDARDEEQANGKRLDKGSSLHLAELVD